MVENKPLVSIVVPIYNVEDYVEKCVDSILNQTYKNLEVILVNDGSTDSTRSILDKYSADTRCSIIDKVNGGQSSARNLGMAKANGCYLYFIDSDDYIDTQAVEKLVAKMQETDADFCCYRIRFYHDDTYKVHGNNFTDDILLPDDILYDAFIGRNIKTTPWAKIFSSKFLKNNSLTFYEGIINEDYLFTLQCAICAEKVAFLDEPLYNALQRPGSTSRNMRDENILVYRKIYSKLVEYMSERNILNKFQASLDQSLAIQLVYTITQAAYRFDTYLNFKKFYDLLNIYDYAGMTMKTNISQVERMKIMIYHLSLCPRIFFICMRIAKYLGFKMI